MLYHRQEIGSTNCLQVSIACLLGVPVEEISRHFDGSEALWNPEKAQLHLFHKFKMNLVEVLFDDIEKKLPLCSIPVVLPCILMGTSPRDSKVLHAVVAEFNKDQFHYVHDPHPEDNFTTDVKSVAFLVSWLK